MPSYAIPVPKSSPERDEAFPAPPEMFLHGRRVSVGAVHFDGHEFRWTRPVRRQPQRRRQSHWWRARGGWVIGLDLLSQVVANGIGTIEYLDELGGRWTMAARRAQQKGEPFDLNGERHLFLPEALWQYTPAPQPATSSAQLQLDLERVP